MPIKKNANRQPPLLAYVDINLADIVSGVAQGAIELPAGATIISGSVEPMVSFNAATSASIAVGDAAVANRYLAAGDVKALSLVPLVPTGFTTTAKSDVTVTVTLVGATTTGKLRLCVQYFKDGRELSSQG